MEKAKKKEGAARGPRPLPEPPFPMHAVPGLEPLAPPFSPPFRLGSRALHVL